MSCHVRLVPLHQREILPHQCTHQPTEKARYRGPIREEVTLTESPKPGAVRAEEMEESTCKQNRTIAVARYSRSECNDETYFAEEYRELFMNGIDTR